jgi:hypothetical protein
MCLEFRLTMVHQKREANPTDEDLTSNWPKGADPATETPHVEPGASQEANDEMRCRQINLSRKRRC